MPPLHLELQTTAGPSERIPLQTPPGNVQDLTWRVIGGSELPQLAPRCIALLIGTNDVNSHTKLADHIAYLEYLLDFLQVGQPGSGKQAVDC